MITSRLYDAIENTSHVQRSPEYGGPLSSTPKEFEGLKSYFISRQPVFHFLLLVAIVFKDPNYVQTNLCIIFFLNYINLILIFTN